MASTSTAPLPTVTEDSFLADRQRFLSSFVSFMTAGVIFVVVLLVLLTIFLV